MDAVFAEERELELVRRAVTGEEVALTVLLTESRVRLFDYLALSISPDFRRIIAPDDIVQETHAEVFRRIGTFEPRGGGSFDRWVTTIAIRRLRSAIKRHRAAKRGGEAHVAHGRRSIEDSTIALLDMLAGPGRTPSGSVARGEAIDAVQTALADLPEPHRKAIHLVHIEGCSAKQAASEMGRTERAIHGLCRRGLRQLRDRLGSESRFLSSSG